MLTLQISEAEIAQAKIQRFAHPSPKSRLRIAVIYEISKGLSRNKVAEETGVHRNSITNYIKIFNSGGFVALETFNYKGSVSCIEPYKNELFEDFQKVPPSTGKEAAFKIFQKTKFDLGLTEVRKFMHRLGLKAIKCGHVPGKLDPQKQQEFHDNTLQPIVNQALAGECHLFFMDAAHFILQPYLARLWCLKRKFIKAGSGRNRMNVLGALHLNTLKTETITNTTYIDATTIFEMLTLIANKYQGKPIKIILDNARYQHCNFVKEAAKELGIELVFLPPYSPNLNLIERLWRYIRKRYLNNKFFETANLFHNTIEAALQNMNESAEVRDELRTLLTPRFQLFAQNLNE